MRAILCERHGPPETLSLRELPTPEPAPGEVRIRVRAASVNFPDALIIQNLYQMKPSLPFSPGSEAAGIVDAVGAGVDGFRAGDRVVAMTTIGAFADQVVVPQERVLGLPESMAFEVGSGFTVVYGTAIHAFKQRAALRAGETVLVLGAAGGVGLAAVEVARAMGARVIAAASSEEKLALARRHGAEDGIDYAREDLRAGIRRIRGDEGIDVVFDPVGGALAEPAFRSIARNGRYLVVGFAAGDIPSIPLNLPLVKQAAIIGVFWGAFVVAEPAVHRRNAELLYEWHAHGLLAPEISRVFPFENTPAAIRWVMERKALGKVVVTMG